MYGVEPAGQVALARHRQRGPADARRSARAALRGRRRPRRPARPDGPARAGRRTASQAGPWRPPAPAGPSTASDGEGHRGVHDDGDAERDRDRPRDGALGVAHLLAERGDPGVSREGEEEQARRLQHSVQRRRPTGRRAAEPPCREPAATTTTTSSSEHRAETSTRASMRGPGDAAVVDRGQGRDGATADESLRPLRPGTAYAANVSAIAAQDAVLPTTNPQPARNPHHSPGAPARRRTCRRRSGTARRAGQMRRRCSKRRPGRGQPDQQAGAGRSPPGANAAKTPAPIIEPSPMTTASLSRADGPAAPCARHIGRARPRSAGRLASSSSDTLGGSPPRSGASCPQPRPSRADVAGTRRGSAHRRLPSGRGARGRCRRATGWRARRARPTRPKSAASGPGGRLNESTCTRLASQTAAGQASADWRVQRPVLVGPDRLRRPASADGAGRSALLAATRRLGDASCSAGSRGTNGSL